MDRANTPERQDRPVAAAFRRPAQAPGLQPALSDLRKSFAFNKGPKNEIVTNNRDLNNAGAAAISIRGVSKSFSRDGDTHRLAALDTVDLEIGRNEFVSLLGPSGCGKSTLLNIIGGLLEPTTGEVFVNDRRVAGPLPNDVAFVFQEDTLLPWYTILQNMNVALEFHGVTREQREVRARAALEAVDMTEFAGYYPHQLSVGMKQRVAMARGLSLRTDIVLMDEPFAALDEQTRMVLGEDLSGLLEQTCKTIVFVTHSLAEAVFLSDRIFVFTARPARVKSIITVEEPHPRRPDFMTSDKFNELRNRLYGLLRDEIRQSVRQNV
jgi:NitT/TauT family transport system ATP-binding protein